MRRFIVYHDRAIRRHGGREILPTNGVAFRELEPDLGVVEVRLAWRSGNDSPALRVAIEASRRMLPDGR